MPFSRGRQWLLRSDRSSCENRPPKLHQDLQRRLCVDPAKVRRPTRARDTAERVLSPAPLTRRCSPRVSQLKSGLAARPRLRRHSHASFAPTPPPVLPRHVGAGRERQGAGPLAGLVGRSRGRGFETGRAVGMAHRVPCEPLCFFWNLVSY